MPIEVPDTVKTWVDSHTDWFEKAVLWFATFDHTLYPVIARTVCKGQGDNVDMADFQTPLHNSYYRVIRAWRDSAEGRDKPITANVASWLSQTAPSKELGPADQVMFRALYEELAGRPMEEFRDCVSRGLGYWMGKRRATLLHVQKSIYRDWDPNEMSKALSNELAFINNSMNPEGHVTEFSFRAMTMRPEIVDCIPTGLVVYDRQLGGGLHRKDGHMVIAAPGVGKTVFALQIAAYAAMQNFTVAFITTEQPPDELIPRIVSNFCHIPFERIRRGFHAGMLPPQDKEKFMKLQKQIANRLYFYDWGLTRKSAATGGLQEEYDDCVRRSGKCDLMVLDWIGGAITDEVKGDKDAKRLAMQMTADSMAQMARDHSMATLSMAQAHKSTGTNNPVVSVSDCTDCKTLDQKMTVVTGITGMFRTDAKDAIKAGQDPSSLGLFEEKQYLFTSKARKSSGGHAPFKRRFDQQRLEDFY